jgi:glycosyltransferase involved in cell wall biosynthesis
VRIVHLYKDYFPPTVGGIEQTLRRLSAGQARMGAEVTVLTSNPGSRRTVEETLDGVRVIRCAEWARAWSTPFCPAMPRELGRLQADVFHLHYPSPTGEVSWLLKRPGGALVLTWHSDVIRQKLVMPIYGPFVHALLRGADAVMPTHSRQAPDSPILRHHLDKVRVVPLGIDLDRFAASESQARRAAELRARWGGGPLVLFVGRLVISKGLDVLLEAMPSVEARCVIVGDGPELGRLKAACARLGIDEKVVFTGRVDPDRVADHIAAADVGVLPSVYEAYGLAMVEMMAKGVPLVCTELGTGTSFINRHRETGFVVPPRDPAALAAALNRLLRDEALRRRMGENARVRAHKRFSSEAMLLGVLEVYRAVLPGGCGLRQLPDIVEAPPAPGPAGPFRRPRF